MEIDSVKYVYPAATITVMDVVKIEGLANHGHTFDRLVRRNGNEVIMYHPFLSREINYRGNHTGLADTTRLPG